MKFKIDKFNIFITSLLFFAIGFYIQVIKHKHRNKISSTIESVLPKNLLTYPEKIIEIPVELVCKDSESIINQMTHNTLNPSLLPHPFNSDYRRLKDVKTLDVILVSENKIVCFDRPKNWQRDILNRKIKVTCNSTVGNGQYELYLLNDDFSPFKTVSIKDANHLVLGHADYKKIQKAYSNHDQNLFITSLRLGNEINYYALNDLNYTWKNDYVHIQNNLVGTKAWYTDHYSDTLQPKKVLYDFQYRKNDKPSSCDMNWTYYDIKNTHLNNYSISKK